MKIVETVKKVFLKHGKINPITPLPYWERKLNQLAKGKALLDTKRIKKSDEVIYTVYSVRDLLEQNNKQVRNSLLKFDVTWLKNGIIKSPKHKQPFQTFGHIHEKYRGEFYYILKGHVKFLLSDIYTNKTIVIDAKTDEWIFIHPKFAHRAIAIDESLFLGIVPEDAGHNYKIIEKNGFPYYVIIKGRKTTYVKNKSLKNTPYLVEYGIIEQTELPDLAKMEKILNYPDENRKYYLEI
ncbi:MAG: hypothetical protein J7K83_03490 [Candidatus Aenigmarchaeota archaeon]|nr:hypothetical protein [Candidatus Aenigmarchaeota archaeon]